MTFVTPITWTPGQLVTAANLNEQIRDNVSALKNPNVDTYLTNESSDFTTTSTSFTDVDGAGAQFTLSFTLAVAAQVLVGFFGNVVSASGTARVYLDISVDGTRVGLDDGLIGAVAPNNTIGQPVSAVWLIETLAAGAHTIILQWKVSGSTLTMFAGAGTANADVHSGFWIKEAN